MISPNLNRFLWKPEQVMNTQQIVQLPIYVLNKRCFAATTGRVNERVAYVHVMFLYSICMKPLRLAG